MMGLTARERRGRGGGRQRDTFFLPTIHNEHGKWGWIFVTLTLAYQDPVLLFSSFLSQLVQEHPENKDKNTRG